MPQNYFLHIALNDRSPAAMLIGPLTMTAPYIVQTNVIRKWMQWGEKKEQTILVQYSSNPAIGLKEINSTLDLAQQEEQQLNGIQALASACSHTRARRDCLWCLRNARFLPHVIKVCFPGKCWFCCLWDPLCAWKESRDCFLPSILTILIK